MDHTYITLGVLLSGVVFAFFEICRYDGIEIIVAYAKKIHTTYKCN